MIVELKVPSPGESISEVEIATWLVQDGDYVEKDQSIAEIDSDKATLELPAEESGIVSLKAEEGDTVAVGQVVATIDTSAADDASQKIEEVVEVTKEAEAPRPVEAVQESTTYATGTASPAAKKILEEKNIQLENISGTGVGGRITKEDALNADTSKVSTSASPQISISAPSLDMPKAKTLEATQLTPTETPMIGATSMGSSSNGSRGVNKTKMSMLRRKIASRLVDVKNQTAMLTTFNEVDMTEVFKLRAEYKEDFKQKHGVGLGFMSFFTLATVKALQKFPQLNAMIDGNELLSYDFCDISIAVSGPKGLMVPVIRNAENLNFRGVEQTIKTLSSKVQQGNISVDEMTGGTFTITNGGVFGSMLSTPIINPPQSAILGMHNIVERAIVKEGQIVAAPVMYLALSYDHRIVDGKEAVGALVTIKEAIENPTELLLGGTDNILKNLEL